MHCAGLINRDLCVDALALSSYFVHFIIRIISIHHGLLLVEFSTGVNHPSPLDRMSKLLLGRMELF